MNKTIGIILAIIIIAGGVYFFTKSGAKDDSSIKNEATTQGEVKSDNTSLKKLLALGQSQKCTFSSEEAGTSSKGTFYVSDGKSRGDFDVTTEGQTIASHMIYDGSTSWMWMDGQTTGFKMKVDENQSNTASAQSVDPDKEYKFDCESWRADSSAFTPPSNVQFSDFSAPVIPATTDTKMDTASICNSLPEPAKSECLASVNQ